MSESDFGKRKPLWFRFITPILKAKRFPKLPDNPQEGKWYRIYPEACVGADGNPTYAQYYHGKENKLIVFFCGGGFSVNEYTAARPLKLFDGDINDMFYTVNTDLVSDFRGRNGITASREANPFASWNKVCIIYDTGDIHVGNNDFPYTAKDGSQQILHHHGYRNYRAVMDTVKEMVPNPESVIVTGCSAGAFGAAMLTDDVVSYFPECKNITCLVDSAMSLSKDFPQIARKVWKAPENLVKHLHSENITLDNMIALAQKYGERVHYLYTCSTRDSALSRIQNYLNGDKMEFTKESGERFQRDYAAMCQQLKENIPNIGIFVFDTMDKGQEKLKLTTHCIIDEELFHTYEVDGVTCAKWVSDAVNGKVHSYGLGLLEI